MTLNSKKNILKHSKKIKKNNQKLNSN